MGGADAGYRTYVAYFPELDAGVITLGNYGSFNSGGVAMQCIDAFFGKDFDPAPSLPEVPQPERKKVVPWKPTAAELTACTGRYYSPELETFYTVSLKDTILTAYQKRLGEIALIPKPERMQFTVNNFALGEVEFKKNDKGIMEMLVSTGRVRHLRFGKDESK